MKLFSILIFFWSIFIKDSYGQKILNSDEFLIKTPFLEQEEKLISQKMGNDGILFLGKSKGQTSGASTYTLEYRGFNLNKKWREEFVVGPEENILHLEAQEKSVVLFSVIHNERQKKSQLQATFFDLEDGHYLEEKILLEHNIDPWHIVEGKGAPVRDFNAIVASGIKKGFVTPLEYRYKLNFSPDGHYLLCYRYNFSKSNLLAEATVFDKSLQMVKSSVLPIDRGYINSGLYLNNEGNIFLLNTKNDGTVAVIYYDLDKKSSSFQELTPSNTQRTGFKLSVEDDYLTKISYLNQRNKDLIGLSYALFDFEKNKIEKVQYHGLVKVLDSASVILGEQVNRDHFHLIDHLSTGDGSAYILERRRYVSAGQNFDPGTGDHLENWKARKGRIMMDEAFVVYIDQNDSLKWGQVINKSQSGISDEGLVSNGINYEMFEDQINLVYAAGTGNVSQIKHVSINLNSGKKTEKELPNAHHIILLRPYTHWVNSKEVIIAGKKGFAGKSSVILKYKLDE